MCVPITYGLARNNLVLIVLSSNKGSGESAHTVKPVLSGHSRKDTKLVFKTDYEKYCRMLQESILQYF